MNEFEDGENGIMITSKIRSRSGDAAFCLLHAAFPVHGKGDLLGFIRLMGKALLGQILILVALAGQAQTIQGQPAADLPFFDFTQAAGGLDWSAVHDLAPLAASADGLVATLHGPDPYLQGPARDYPPGKLLWLNLRLKSEEGGDAQVFYFTETATESQSVRFRVEGGRWQDVRIPMPALGPAYRLRVDPPGQRGSCVLARVGFEERVVLTPPAWPKPAIPDADARPLVLESGELRLVHNRTQLGGFRLQAAGEEAAIGQTSGLLGYLVGREIRWTPMGHGGDAQVSCRGDGNGVAVRASWSDSDGARWTVQHQFQPDEPNAIRVAATVTADRDRNVVYLPVFTLFPGVGSHGTHKHQALFAGLEYLENEPSSSEADVIGPESWRQVPDTLKITFPLMALQAGAHYVGLTWEPQPDLCAVHDSPDRQFQSGGHLMGLLQPGSRGWDREERSLLPYDGVVLRAGVTWSVNATILGGRGETVVPAVQHYVQKQGLPAPPDHGYSAASYCRLAARGWLESKAREGNLYRHAVWPGFKAQPAADAALWMEWLAGALPATELVEPLRAASKAALEASTPEAFNSQQISHNRRPLPALIYGSVAANVEQQRQHGRAILRRFQADGTVAYQPRPGGVDYARTHGSREANGLTAEAVGSLLEAAMFCGDAALLEAGLRHLRSLNKFRLTVPRGAQTWEVPLHTPDILASANLVRAYTLSYELTGDASLLDEARYWAWTGVPFVYLAPPGPGPVGLYGTIPVLGATGWEAPVWLGRPVQWCGLVYADALQQLRPHDPTGPWKQLADGIVAAGLQHTWPAEDAERRGLLPDFYLLRAQQRDGPAINPGTLLLPALDYFGAPAPYARQVFREHEWIVHAPGGLTELSEEKLGVSFRVQTWSPRPCWLLVAGVRKAPAVILNGQPVALRAPHQDHTEQGYLILQLQGPTSVRLDQ